MCMRVKIREMGNKYNMKQLITGMVLILTVIASGCGRDNGGGTPEYKGCAGMEGLGTWTNNQGQIEFKENCQGKDTYCGSEFVFAKPIGNYMLVDIKKTNGNAGCLSVGKHDCQFVQDPNNLAFDCGNGAVYFGK